MIVKFCDCGGMLVPHKEGMVCRRCSKIVKGKTINNMKTERRQKKDIAVIEDNKPDLPITDEKQCPKCNNKKSYFWLIQTRSVDEPPTQFYRCTKCKYTWREYK